MMPTAAKAGNEEAPVRVQEQRRKVRQSRIKSENITVD